MEPHIIRMFNKLGFTVRFDRYSDDDTTSVLEVIQDKSAPPNPTGLTYFSCKMVTDFSNCGLMQLHTFAWTYEIDVLTREQKVLIANFLQIIIKSHVSNKYKIYTTNQHQTETESLLEFMGFYQTGEFVNPNSGNTIHIWLGPPNLLENLKPEEVIKLPAYGEY